MAGFHERGVIEDAVCLFGRDLGHLGRFHGVGRFARLLLGLGCFEAFGWIVRFAISIEGPKPISFQSKVVRVGWDRALRFLQHWSCGSGRFSILARAGFGWVSFV